MNSRKLFVGNLTYTVNARDLKTLFSQYGDVVSVNVLEKKGYGFIEMKTPEEAQKARESLSETEFEGRNLLIDGVRPPKKKKKFTGKPTITSPAGRTQSHTNKKPASSGSGYRGKKPAYPSGNQSGRPATSHRKSSSPPPRRNTGRGQRR
jgi:RNA recognition motif-containing protein